LASTGRTTLLPAVTRPVSLAATGGRFGRLTVIVTWPVAVCPTLSCTL
jgi:hypothetical protein